MKLILLTAFIIKFTVEANEQYSFAPQFHKPNQGSYGSESSIFLPPEAHTPIPYYPVKNLNNLPFPYLPPTGTKAPSVYPSPFPGILSSTLIPIFDDDDNENEDKKRKNNNVSSPTPHTNNQKQNISENVARVQHAMRREMRASPKMGNYHNPIDRIDMRFQQQFAAAQTTSNPGNQTPRNLIIDTHRNDIFDQIRSPSSQNPHYVAAHGFTISSTTEPAIPIIRLSNEMDLDGSFSYEALGADQTHYVQHSHMENLGSDKQEQVVEGSYSYVGDNGQTYTVNYIADSNGFRASGDHLPVAPPIPEIIQRAIQYNLAEEAKKPQHLRGWQDDEKDFDLNERGQQFAVPPSRNLFTGRTPEAFSHSFSQGTNSENILTAASSSQIPVKSNTEYIIDQTKAKNNNGPIAPQITFLASQGAHVPSMNQQSVQQSISRIFNNDKSTMPQLINYDAGNKEAELEGNKALWRWQYGLNTNNLSQTPEKNTISRSFGEGDDIMINFSDMTPEQYTKMLHSELDHNNKDSGTSSVYLNNNNDENGRDNKNNNHMKNNENSQLSYQTGNYISPSVNIVQPSQTESLSQSTTASYINKSPLYYSNKDSNNFLSESYSTVSTYGNFGSQSQSYSNQNEYNETPYEFKRTKALHVDSATKSNIQSRNTIPVLKNSNKVLYESWSSTKIPDNVIHTITQVPPIFSTTNIPKFSNFYDENTDFKPIHKPFQETRETTTVPPQTTTENIFQTNIFLKSINTNSKKSDSFNIEKEEDQKQTKATHKKVVDDSKHIMQIPNKFSAETKTDDKVDKYPNYIPYQSQQDIEVKHVKAKPSLELADVLNYITNKNLFESSKLKPRINNANYDDFAENNKMRYVMHQQEEDEDDRDEVISRPHNNPRYNREEREELRGIIKNYKVLQRNHNAKKLESNGYHVRKEMTQPSIRTMQSSGLPPLGRAGPSMKTYLPPIYV